MIGAKPTPTLLLLRSEWKVGKMIIHGCSWMLISEFFEALPCSKSLNLTNFLARTFQVLLDYLSSTKIKVAKGENPNLQDGPILSLVIFVGWHSSTDFGGEIAPVTKFIRRLLNTSYIF